MGVEEGGRGHNAVDSVGGSHPAHFHGLLPIDRIIVEAGQNVAVQVNHWYFPSSRQDPLLDAHSPLRLIGAESGHVDPSRSLRRTPECLKTEILPGEVFRAMRIRTRSHAPERPPCGRRDWILDTVTSEGGQLPARPPMEDHSTHLRTARGPRCSSANSTIESGPGAVP